MQVAVWDTYVQKKNGQTMHFDIIVPDTLKDEKTVYDFGRSYLKKKGQDGQELSSEECSYCHIEQASAEMQTAIKQQGYFIIEMEGCD